MMTMILFWSIVIYSIDNILLLDETTIMITIALMILLTAVYLFLLKNNLDEIQNEYTYDINEYDKKYKKRFEETQNDLEKRGMTFSGEAVKKLGSESAVSAESFGKPIQKGELEVDKEDYKKYHVKKFELAFKKAKYKVIINLLSRI